MALRPQPGDFHTEIENAGARAYSPHRYDFALDLNPLIDALSPAAKFFFLLDAEELAREGNLHPNELFRRPWRDDAFLLTEFLKMTSSEQVEILTLYTFSLHETRHHIDFSTTPYGARFYCLLADEYLAFQGCSPFLLQNQELISSGAVAKLADRLAQISALVPSDWMVSWKAFRATTERLLATVDTRGRTPDWSRAKQTSDLQTLVGGMTFHPVSLFGRAWSYCIEGRPQWYMRASTLLEGRAVLQSILWIIDSIGVETPGLNNILGAYMRANYARADTPYDYLFLLDVAAARLGDTDFDSMLRRPSVTVRSLLQIVDNAAWFGLNAGLHSDPDGGRLRPENMFTRFLFGLKALDRLFAGTGESPYSILAGAETSDAARESGVVPTPSALEMALAGLRQMSEAIKQIWQSQMVDHFDTVLGVLSRSIERRLSTGLALPAGAPADGVAAPLLDQETYDDLIRPYSPGKWVHEWFDFRNKNMFSITPAKTTLRHLRGQFGLAEVVMPCECGTLLSRTVPKWRPATVIMCADCGRQHRVTEDDFVVINVPDEI